jgi:four helix bundle protein
MKSVEDLDVFKLAHHLALKTYSATKVFPREETFSLLDQMRRAATSVGMNLMEGAMRLGSREYRQFVGIARGSAGEVCYQLLLAKDLKYIPTKPTRSCGLAMIVSSKCFPVSHRVLIARFDHEHGGSPAHDHVSSYTRTRATNTGFMDKTKPHGLFLKDNFFSKLFTIRQQSLPRVRLR